MTVSKIDDLLGADFPSRKSSKIEVDPIAQDSINASIKEAYMSIDIYFLLESEEQIRDLEINIENIKKINECFTFIVTAQSSYKEYDFVSKFFAPNAGIIEDPVTGSSHSTLIPFWAERLKKNKLIAKQLSRRGGILYCENKGNRVKIYLEGEMKL